MKMSQSIGAAVLLGASVAVFQVGAFASGSAVPSAPAGPSAPNRSPEEMAIASYNSGIDHKDKGIKLELAAAGITDPKDRAKADDKAKKEFEKALKDFKSAASGSPNMYQAYNGMGFWYRKTGDYVKALEMYDRALTLKPGFPDAIEYRGEAYLGLNRVEDAKKRVPRGPRRGPEAGRHADGGDAEVDRAEEDQPGGRRSGRGRESRDLGEGARRARPGDRGDGPQPRPALVSCSPMTWWTGLVAAAVLVSAAACAGSGPPPDPPRPTLPSSGSCPVGCRTQPSPPTTR